MINKLSGVEIFAIRKTASQATFPSSRRRLKMAKRPSYLGKKQLAKLAKLAKLSK